MPINLNDRSRESASQLVQAFKGDDAKALEDALVAYQAAVAADLEEQYNAAMEAHDEQVLAQRGFTQLTKQETAYFQAVIDALSGDNPKQDLTRLATIGDGTGQTDIKTRMLPETIIDQILRDIEEKHELLGIIGVRNVGAVTHYMRNKHSRQLAVWGQVESAIAKAITSAFDVVTVTQGKLSCYAAVSQDMLALGPRWMGAYVRTVLAEAMACGLEAGVIDGKGIKGEPIGLKRDILEDVSQSTGYAEKTAVEVTDFLPASYGALVAQLALDDEEKVKSDLSGLTLVCNTVDYLTKVMPATTVLTNAGTYAHDLFPIPTRVVTSEFLEEGEAVLFLANEYDLLAGGNRGIEYDDGYQFLEDNRVFKVVQYAFGLPQWNTTAIVLDLSGLNPAYLTVRVADVVKTQEQE